MSEDEIIYGTEFLFLAFCHGFAKIPWTVSRAIAMGSSSYTGTLVTEHESPLATCAALLIQRMFKLQLWIAQSPSNHRSSIQLASVLLPAVVRHVVDFLLIHRHHRQNQLDDQDEVSYVASLAAAARRAIALMGAASAGREHVR